MNSASTSFHDVPVPGGSIRYELRWMPRRRTVGITVEPDRRVVVLAPRTANVERVATFVSRRIRWIRRQWERIESLPPPMPPRQWVAGETHRYLGRQYRLKFLKADESTVKLLGGYFVVSLPVHSPSRVRELLEAWYRERAEALLPIRVEQALKTTKWLEVGMPEIRVGLLHYRWGSTSPSGRVLFNVDLVKVPLPCVDYVVAHELVHLRIPNHSPAFWRMLGRVMPDWKRWRERLERVEI